MNSEQTSDGFRVELVARLPRLRRFARGLTGSTDQADDLVQEACEKALRKKHQWQPGTSLDSWLYRIVQNAWIDTLRSGEQRRRATEPVDPETIAAGDVRRETDARLTLSSVQRALQMLSPDQRSVILLVCVEGLSYAEAAQSLGWPMGTVMSRLARARLQLHRLVEGSFASCQGQADERGSHATV